jgi:hypothetical protein
MFGILAMFGDAGAAAGPWLAGAVAEATSGTQGTLRALAALLPAAGGSGLRAGLLIGTMFPLGVVAATLAHSIAARHRAHNARATNTP